MSATGRFRYSGASWATKAIPSSASGEPAGMPPSTVTPPSVGLVRPTAMVSRVVLPAPFGPTRATIWPPGMSRVQSRRAHVRRYRLPSAVDSMTFMIGYARERAVTLDIRLNGISLVDLGTPGFGCQASLRADPPPTRLELLAVALPGTDEDCR